MSAPTPRDPAGETPINQCDGCRRGMPVNSRGVHYGRGYDFITCTAWRYAASTPSETPDADR